MYNFCPNCGTYVNKKGHEFTCKKCGKSFYTNSRPTATVIPMHGKEMLLGVRAHDPHKGGNDFLGGFVNNGEHPLDAATREIEEEIGLKINKADLEFLDVWIDEYVYQDIPFHTFNMIYILPVKKKFKVKVADDVESTKWVHLDDELVLAFEHQKEIIKKLKEIHG